MTISLYTPSDDDGRTYTPQLECSRCGTVTFTGLRYASHAAAQEAASRRVEGHIADHEREDAIAKDPFYGLTD